MKLTKAKKNILIMLLVCGLAIIAITIASVYGSMGDSTTLAVSAKEVKASANSWNNAYIVDMSAYPVTDKTIHPSIASYRTSYGIGEEIKIVVKLSEDVNSIKNINICLRFGDDGPERDVTKMKVGGNLEYQFGYLEAYYTLQEGDNGELNVTYFSADIETINGFKDTLVLPEVNKNNIVADTTPHVINNSVTPTGYVKAGTTITSTITFSEDAYVLVNDVIMPLSKLNEDPSLSEIRVYFSSEERVSINNSQRGINDESKKIKVIDSKTLQITYTVAEGDNGKMYIYLDGICDIAGNYYYEDLPSTLVNIADITVDTIKPEIEEVTIINESAMKYYTKSSEQVYEKANGRAYSRTGNENCTWENDHLHAFANEGDEITISIKFNEKVHAGDSTGLGFKLGKDIKYVVTSTDEDSKTLRYTYTVNKEDWNGQESLKLVLADSAVDLAGNEIDLKGIDGWMKAQPDKDGKAQPPIDELDTPIFVDTVAPTITGFQELYANAGTPKYNKNGKYYYSQETKIDFKVNWSEYIYSEGNPNMDLKINIDNVLFTTKQKPTPSTDHRTFTYTTSNIFTKNGLLSVTQDSNIVTDLAGNYNIGKSNTYKDYIDNHRPTIKVAEKSRDNDSITYSFTLSDGTEVYQSGVKAYSLTDINDIVVTNGDIMEYTLNSSKNIVSIKVLPSMDGKQRVYVKEGAFTDNVENPSLASNVYTANVDTTPPEVVFAESGSSYDYLGETVKIGTTVTVFDNAGIGKIEYAWSNNNTTAPTTWTETANSKFISKDVSAEGVWYLWVKVTDIVGNPHTVVSGAFEVVADKTAPTISLAQSEGQYEITDVEIKTTIGTTVTVDDNKGVKEIKYAWSRNNEEVPAEWTTTQNSQNVSKTIAFESAWYLWVEATDIAGNVTRIVSGVFQVTYRDITKPEITVDVENGVYYVGNAGEQITVKVNIKDENLASARFAWTKEDNEPGTYQAIGDTSTITIDVTKEDIGSWYLWIEAVDTFGNTRTTKFGSYTVLDAIDSIKINTEDNSCIDDVVIKNDMRYLVVSENTTVELLKEYIETEEELVFVDETAGDEIANEQTLKTNDIIMVPSIGDADPQYIIVVKGDINADGKIDMGDIIKLNKYRNRSIEITDAEKVAGDIIKDGKTSLNDVLRLNKYRLGKIAYL